MQKKVTIATGIVAIVAVIVVAGLAGLMCWVMSLEKVMTLPCDDSVGGFLTASALLVAILVVWLGFWVRARPIGYGRAEQFRACLGIAWVCLAIVFVFIACAWSFWDCSTGGECISRGAVSFGMTAFFMASCAILESLFTAALVLLGKADLKKPTAPVETKAQKCHWVVAMLFVVIGFFLMSLGLTGADPIPRWVGVLGVVMAGSGVVCCGIRKLASLNNKKKKGGKAIPIGC